jgi:transposase
MKVKQVSALRSKRGLHRMNGAEPPVVGLTPQTTMKRKANTMKTYILRQPKPVESQTPVRAPRRKTATMTTTTVVLGRPPAPTNARVLFTGFDVHTDSIAVSLAPSDTTEVRRYGIIGGTHDDVLKLLTKLQAAHPGTELRCAYEAGPHGFSLARCLHRHGYGCILVAPSKIPRPPGDRIKTNRRDADQLARLYRAGELTAIHVPDPADEAFRDLIRARAQVGDQQHRSRQQLKMFLLRHNLRYTGQSAWSPAHLRYLAKLKLPFPVQQIAFQEMLDGITEAADRLARYDTEIARAVPGWRWAPTVRALMALRGFALLHAATLIAELGDFHRFSHPAQLMNYLGLVPSENSTGDQRCQGGITKTGNAIARRALVEAAWQYRSPARLSPHLKKRQEGLPKAVTDIAWEAQRRLHHRYVHLTRTGKKKAQVAVTAVARELAGFVWAIACQVQPIAPKS